MLSIHPFSAAYPGLGLGGSNLSRDAQTSLLLPAPPAHPVGGAKGISEQAEIISPVCPGSTMGLLRGRTYLKHLN